MGIDGRSVCVCVFKAGKREKELEQEKAMKGTVGPRCADRSAVRRQERLQKEQAGDVKIILATRKID